MPIKETNTSFYICIDDNYRIPLGEISEVQLKEEDIKETDHIRFDSCEEMTFEIKPPQNYRELKTFIEIIHPSLSWLSWWVRRYGNNNWRKMNHLPMIRRLRK